MTLVMNPQFGTIEEPEGILEMTSKDSPKEEFTIIRSNKVTHPSPMPESLKQEKQKNAPELSKLFQETLKVTHQDNSQCNWIDDDVVEVGSLSQNCVHRFVLEAEALGKNVTYIKQTIIRIED